MMIIAGWACLTPDNVPGSGGHVFALVPAQLEVINEADRPADVAMFIASEYGTEADAALYFSPAGMQACRPVAAASRRYGRAPGPITARSDDWPKIRTAGCPCTLTM
ncbi:MAG: hypothetical protein L6Q69_21435 [Zoogloea sp.]|nr:hypothetical protein [Zoogloea sp.]